MRFIYRKYQRTVCGQAGHRYKPEEAVPLAFTHVRVANKERLYTNGTLQLHERDKSLYIEFAALDYDASTFANYYYRLKGFDDKWIKVPANRRQAAYTNLRPGNYTFELRYAPDGKQWLEEMAELHIAVSPYFYKTIWFILSILVLLSFLIYKVLSWRLRSLKEQQEILHIKVEERTRELEEQKKLLSTQASELYRQNQLLKQQNEKITKQKGQLIQMSKKVQELTVDKLAFFTNITHEFRTPLTLIVGPIERALKLSYNPQVIEQLHFVERNSKYLLSLVNQLMDFRKVESGKMEIVRNPGNFAKLLNELLVPFDAYASERGITIERRFRLPSCEIMYDEDAMHKVIVNLIGNALKFTPKGGQITIYATPLRQEEQEKLFICIRDTGPGLPEEEIDKVFNRFYQSQNRRIPLSTDKAGLESVSIYANELSSCMEVQFVPKNNQSKGCSFRILLPLQYADADSLPTPTEQVKEPVDSPMTLQPATNGKLTILVVEDNKDMRDYIRSILAEYYNVLEASQGEEALTVLQSQNVDFIVSDLMMPVMDGFTLLKKIKTNLEFSHIPIILLTAKNTLQSRMEGLELGADAYIDKPFSMDLLLTQVTNLLNNRSNMRAYYFNSPIANIKSMAYTKADEKFLKKLNDIIDSHINDVNLDVDMIADLMNLSRPTLYRKINGLSNVTPNELIKISRLKKAAELILQGDMRIYEIAEAVGFNSQSYFSRAFSKQFNMSPSQYAKENNIELK